MAPAWPPCSQPPQIGLPCSVSSGAGCQPWAPTGQPSRVQPGTEKQGQGGGAGEEESPAMCPCPALSVTPAQAPEIMDVHKDSLSCLRGLVVRRRVLNFLLSLPSPPHSLCPPALDLLRSWVLFVVTGSQMPVLASSAVFLSSGGSHTQVGRGKAVAEAQSHWGTEASKPLGADLAPGHAKEGRAAASQRDPCSRGAEWRRPPLRPLTL